jgi:hypothetical protein
MFIGTVSLATLLEKCAAGYLSPLRFQAASGHAYRGDETRERAAAYTSS